MAPKKKQKPATFSKSLFEALKDPEQSESFALESGEIGDVRGYFVTALDRQGRPRPVALILTDEVRALIDEALDTLFEDVPDDEDEGDGEEDEHEDVGQTPRRRASRFFS